MCINTEGCQSSCRLPELFMYSGDKHGPGKPTTHKALRANDDAAGLGRGILDGDLVYVVFPLDETSSEEIRMRSLVSV